VFVHQIGLVSRILNACTNASLNGNDGEVHDTPDEDGDQTYLYHELAKSKKRLKKMSMDMNKLHNLLRLIVQKMEINTEADCLDEDESDGIMGHELDVGWSTSRLRHDLPKQALLVSKWKSQD